ncbi:MAG: PPC domain-containing protein [Chloroflexota bacterium]
MRYQFPFGFLLGMAVIILMGSASAVVPAVASPTPTPDILPTPKPIAETVRERYGDQEDNPTPTPTTVDDGVQDADEQPTPTLEPVPGTQEDACEPNDTLLEPCAIPAYTVITDLTFVDDDNDVYSVFLKASRTISVAVDVSDGIDPVVTVYRADDTETVIAENDDVSVEDVSSEVSFPVETDGWYLIQVDNRASGSMEGYTYTITTRGTAEAAESVDEVPSHEALAFDVFEPNHMPDLAGRIGWGVPYDLNLLCPVEHMVSVAAACPAGDHDYFRMQTTAGISMTILTYNLAPGLNTTVTVHKPDVAQEHNEAGAVAGWRAIYANDDVFPGWTMRSRIDFTPDWTGGALVVVANAERDNPARVPDDVTDPGRYGLMVGPPNLAPIRELISTFDDIPPTPEPDLPLEHGDSSQTLSPTALITTTLVPTGVPQDYEIQPGVANDPREVVSGECMTGTGRVHNAEGTMLWAAKNPTETDAVVLLSVNTEVALLGECEGRWVHVAPTIYVSSGWVAYPDIEPLNVVSPWGDESSAHRDQIVPWETTPTVSPSPDDIPISERDDDVGLPEVTPPVSESTSLEVTPIGPAPVPTVEQPERAARVALVEVCALEPSTPQTCATPLTDVLVHVSHGATRERLGSGRTDANGVARISVSVLPTTALRIALPVYGIEQEVRELPTGETPITVRIPAHEEEIE